MSSGRRWIASGIALWALPGLAVAEETAVAGSGAAPLLHGKLELSLADAIQMGLENNLNVQVERYAPLIAQRDEKAAWGAFDPTLFGEVGYSDSTTPNSFSINQNPQSIVKTTDGFAGFRGTLPMLGSEYNAQFNGDGITTNSTVEALSPKFDSSWSINFVQPLLKDLIWNQPWTQVKTSKVVLQASQENFRTSVMDTVGAIEDSYWKLIAAEERVRVAHKSQETARALLDQTQTQFEVGVVSKVEVIEAEAGVSQREFNVIVAENRYRNQQDELIDLVLGPGLRASSTLEIEPKDRPDEFIAYQIDVEQAVRIAFENRPELAAAQKDIERITINVQFAKNQRLPELDAIISFGRTGLAGSQNDDLSCRFFDPLDPDPDSGFNRCTQGRLVEPTNFGDTADLYSDNPQFTARGRFSIPLPNTTARQTVSRRKLELRRAETQHKRVEQQIILEVRVAARTLKAAQEGIEAAETASRAAAEQLRAEKIRLEYGESTPFAVLQREEEFVDRETDLIDSYQTYRESATALDRFQGTILRNRNIKIDQVSALR